MKRIISIICSLLCTSIAYLANAQDPQFSQTFNAPQYLNPALVGGEQLTRVGLNHRGQWLGMPGYFVTTMAAVDAYIKPSSSGSSSALRNLGIGGFILNDVSGGAGLVRNHAAATFSCEFALNDRLAFRTGGQVGFGQQTINFSKLVFGDMISTTGLTGLPSQEGLAGSQTIIYPEIAWGGMLYSPSFQFGLSLHHLNQPNISFIGDRATLPIRFTAHTSWIIPMLLSRDARKAPLQYAKPFIMYRRQGVYDQFDAGANIMLDPIVLGLWYRGLLLKQEGRTWNNQDAICLYFGVNWGDFEFGTSYDVTVSRLDPATTGGSYEISLRYLIGKSKVRTINGFTSSGDRGTSCPSWSNSLQRNKNPYNRNRSNQPKRR
jgi:type IX secretion system PorP/SprF family membrane protein